jgi:hypothetical protein
MSARRRRAPGGPHHDICGCGQEARAPSGLHDGLRHNIAGRCKGGSRSDPGPVGATHATPQEKCRGTAAPCPRRFLGVPPLDRYTKAERTGALVILPERRQRVHTRMRRTPPLTLARTRCRFGCHVRLVLLFAWLTLWPTERCFPQISQLLAMAWSSRRAPVASGTNKLCKGRRARWMRSLWYLR